jgi:hypothetical protein
LNTIWAELDRLNLTESDLIDQVVTFLFAGTLLLPCLDCGSVTPGERMIVFEAIE